MLSCYMQFCLTFSPTLNSAVCDLASAASLPSDDPLGEGEGSRWWAPPSEEGWEWRSGDTGWRLGDEEVEGGEHGFSTSAATGS